MVNLQDFLCGPGVKRLHGPKAGRVWVRSLVRKVRSHVCTAQPKTLNFQNKWIKRWILCYVNFTSIRNKKLGWSSWKPARRKCCSCQCRQPAGISDLTPVRAVVSKATSSSRDLLAACIAFLQISCSFPSWLTLQDVVSYRQMGSWGSQRVRWIFQDHPLWLFLHIRNLGLYF